MGRKRNPKSQENHRQNPRFLQIPLLQISKNPSQINVVRVLHGGRIIHQDEGVSRFRIGSPGVAGFGWC
jgi:hypothetical protein